MNAYNINNASLVTAESVKQADIQISQGRFSSLQTGEQIDAQGLLLFPGVVELSANLREPGESYITTIQDESFAAAQRGITTLCCEPDTKPVIDSTAVIDSIWQKANAAKGAKIEIIAALTQGLKGQALSQMASFKQAGVKAVSMALEPIQDSNVLRRALQYAKSVDLPVFLHPQDAFLTHQGVAHAGKVSSRLGLPAIPAAAEIAGLARDLALVEDTGARVHFCRLSCAQCLQLIRQAKLAGLPVTADVAIQHVFLTENDLMSFNTNMHLRPPLRTDYDRVAIRQALQDGTIDALTSQHQPLDPASKKAPFPLSRPGQSGLDTFFSLAYKLIEENILTLPQLVALTSHNPRKILGLPKIDFSTGQPADCFLFNPHTAWQCTQESAVSRGCNLAFENWPLHGQVEKTFVAGNLVFSS